MLLLPFDGLRINPRNRAPKTLSPPGRQRNGRLSCCWARLTSKQDGGTYRCELGAAATLGCVRLFKHLWLLIVSAAPRGNKARN